MIFFKSVLLKAIKIAFYYLPLRFLLDSVLNLNRLFI